MSNKYFIILSILFLISINSIFAESPDSSFVKIKCNQKLIIEACNLFDINPKILSAVIFVERTQNYTWEDDALDEYLAQAGLNSSICFCQVKIKTAYWIELKLNDTNSLFFPGYKYRSLLKVSKNPEEIISKLQNDSLNILYAAAYLRIMESRWRKVGFPIDERADIFGTLYSTGLFYRNGRERKPNKNPKSNRFGKLVEKNLFKF